MNKSLKKLLNKPETTTHDRLKAVCTSYNAQVFAKVRVADILPIQNSGISTDEYSYALRAHFDFVVTDDKSLPLFAVEFDGPTHESIIQKSRDAIKLDLCKNFNFPILRIDSNYLTATYRGWDLLSWITEVWFLDKEWSVAQERGEIPYDEPFDPCSIVNMDGCSERFPFWFSAPAQNQIQKLCDKGEIAVPCGGSLTSFGTSGHEAIGWVRISNNSVAFEKVSLRASGFAIPLFDLIGQLVTCGVYNAIIDHLASSKPVISLEVAKREIQNFKTIHGKFWFSGMQDPIVYEA